jgi:triosephosphate isomerase
MSNTNTRRPIVGGNWKMHTDTASGTSLARAVVTGRGDGAAEVVVFPPFTTLAAVAGELAGGPIALGAQDVSDQEEGAFTGEVSAAMLLDAGCTWVLAGHSERRHVLGESDDLVAAKLRRALDAGLNVVLCVGETLEQREAGETEIVVAAQLKTGLAGVAKSDLERLVIAYEPVWAIGTGRQASPDDAQNVHALLRRTAADLYDVSIPDRLRIQYGGSVKPATASALFDEADIDGGLIGGASLDADSFLEIIHAADRSVASEHSARQ